MTATGPSKKDFADLINGLVGHRVVNDKILDGILEDAKESYHRQGLDGFFEYIRRLTGIPLGNKEMKELLDTIIGAGRPEKALTGLIDREWISKEQARLIGQGLGTSPEKRAQGKGRRKKRSR
ncbi:hypothetical protein GCM10007416_09060 [Kroppenstedtia guangzhouensis]|uniref:Uncharacterized protein n=1 Tax=Kroppenstedtia guangzhouensis TaxID=1274356 RepID=A0ABQ1G7G4_9BACL|nr:hypothetical protein [Kroppenstedtia guangzhouensis]GGA38269.1 hypothetical protein GCM10007416_09060 [Kroppenstedtia guangzhouensis]